MVRLGLFFTFMTDCWYPSRKPKCKSHLWLHRCSPSGPSPQVQTCSLWQQPWPRTVGAGCSVLARRCAPVLVSAPLFLPVGIYLCQQMCRWSVLVLGFEEHTPTNPPNEPSVFNDLSSGGWAVFFVFFFSSSVDRKFFSIVPGGFMLQILSSGFSFY